MQQLLPDILRMVRLKRAGTCGYQIWIRGRWSRFTALEDRKSREEDEVDEAEERR